MILKIGHRGAAGLEPENTLRAFKHAMDLGVDMIEFDVHLCKSGELAVIHDETLNRTTNGKGKIIDKTLDELKKLDAGKGEKIPTIDEVLDLVDHKTKVNIELKGRDTAKPVAATITKYVAKGWSHYDFLISSFNAKELEVFHQLISFVALGLVLKEKPNKKIFDFARILNITSLHLPYDKIDYKVIDEVHRNSFKVFVFTLNKKEDIERMTALGIDGIFSDRPDLL